MINKEKLIGEIQSQIPDVIGISTVLGNEIQTDYVNSYFTSKCRIDFESEPTQEQKNQCDIIIAAHDPNPTKQELVDYDCYLELFENYHKLFLLIDAIIGWYEKIITEYPELAQTEMDAILARLIEIKNSHQ